MYVICPSEICLLYPFEFFKEFSILILRKTETDLISNPIFAIIFLKIAVKNNSRIVIVVNISCRKLCH